MDDNLRRRIDVVLDYLDEQMRSGAHVVRELVTELDQIKDYLKEQHGIDEPSAIRAVRSCEEEWTDHCNEIERERDEARAEMVRLQAWKAGATGAAIVMYPVHTGPHTEEAYCVHKDAYAGGSEEYRLGADVISAGYLAAKEAIK